MAKKRGAGEGSIYKRKHGKGKSKWAAAVTIGHDEEGKPKRKTVYGATRGEVSEKLNNILVSVNSGTYKEPAKITVAEWLDTWLNDYMKNSLRATTWHSYEVQIRRHLKPAIGHLKLNQLTTSHLQRLYNDKLSGGRCDNKKGGLSAKSVRYMHGVIYGSLEQAKKEGMLIINPADSVKLPKLEKPDIEFFDSDQIAVFLNEAKKTQYFTAYYLELATGLRRGELLGLRWKDIDLLARTVTVNQGLVRTKQGLVFQAPKTKQSKRTISIPADVAEILKFHKKRQNGLKEKAGLAWAIEHVFLQEKPEPNDLVFTNEIGRPLDPSSLTRHFKRLIVKINQEIEVVGKREKWKQEDIEVKKLPPKISFHGLRHTYATLCLQLGVDMKTTQENLGHFDPGFTLSVYSNVTQKMNQEATDKINNALLACLNEK
ncbi:MAG: tyrosine-type recombinase/integrase [Perlabentimonas sp.]